MTTAEELIARDEWVEDYRGFTLHLGVQGMDEWPRRNLDLDQRIYCEHCQRHLAWCKVAWQVCDPGPDSGTETCPDGNGRQWEHSPTQ